MTVAHGTSSKVLHNFFINNVRENTCFYLSRELARIAPSLLYPNLKTSHDDYHALVKKPLVISIIRKLIARISYIESLVGCKCTLDFPQFNMWKTRSGRFCEGEENPTVKYGHKRFSFADASRFLKFVLLDTNVKSFQYIECKEMDIREEGHILASTFRFLVCRIIDGKQITSVLPWLSRSLTSGVRDYMARKNELRLMHLNQNITVLDTQKKLLNEWLSHHSHISYVEGKVHEEVEGVARMIDHDILTLQRFYCEEDDDVTGNDFFPTQLISSAPFANRITLMHTMVIDKEFEYHFYAEHSLIYSVVMNRVDEVLETVFWEYISSHLCTQRGLLMGVSRLLMSIYWNLKHCCKGKLHCGRIEEIFQISTLVQELSTMGNDVAVEACRIVKKAIPVVSAYVSSMGYTPEVEDMKADWESYGYSPILRLKNFYAWSMRFVLIYRKSVIERDYIMVTSNLVPEKQMYLISRRGEWERCYPRTRRWVDNLYDRASLKIELAMHIVNSTKLSDLLEVFYHDRHRVIEMAIRFHLIVKIGVIVYTIQKTVGLKKSESIVNPLVQQLETNLQDRAYVGDGIMYEVDTFLKGLSESETLNLRKTIGINATRGSQRYHHFSDICIENIMRGASIPFMRNSLNILREFILFNISVYRPLYDYFMQKQGWIFKD